jgi:predicted O-methyltransferase YrrM
VAGEGVRRGKDVGPDQSAQRLRFVIERLFREGSVRSRADGTVHQLFPVGIREEEGNALREWVTREVATRTIEVGLAYGISALFTCEGLLATGASDVRHVVLDPNQETRFANCGLQILDEAGVRDLLEYHREESAIVLPRFLSEARRFDFAFVDGSHRFDGVFLDLMYLGRLVRPGGIIFVDDYQLRSVARAVSFCTSNLGWTVVELSTRDLLHEWVVLRTVTVPIQRSFDHYVDF